MPKKCFLGLYILAAMVADYLFQRPIYNSPTFGDHLQSPVLLLADVLW